MVSTFTKILSLPKLFSKPCENSLSFSRHFRSKALPYLVPLPATKPPQPATSIF